jgi:YD repeat-containing protein
MFRSVKHWVWLLLFWFVLAGQVGAMPCDVDNDGDIDLNDLTLIQKSILARAAVTGPSDPRDPDQNGLINSIDGRLCALRCTRAKCSTINQTPFANAGPDQTVKVGDPVQLSGAASSDPDGDPLRYSWTFKNHPLGSLASLLDAVTVAPRFTADKPGQYVIQLIVSDGKLDSVPDTVIVSTENSRPIANAGPDQSVRVGTLVMLNGGGSTDVDGDPLTYTWQLASVPPGSGATLGNPDTVNPTLLIDQPGSYLIALTVSDGKVPSLPDTVAVTTENSPPVANPGPNQSIPLGATITLNGSHSSDVDGNPLTFRWSLLARPPGSAAVLSNPNTVTPSFNADAPGTYVAQLIVNDGTVDSAPASVTLTTANAAPIANAGPDQSAALGSSATLDGSASHDPEGAALTYTWSLTGRPAGSAATLSGSDTVNPSFTLDRPGNYIAQLIVSDGQLASAPDTVTLSTTNSRPVANAGAAQTVTAGTPVKLDGSASHDADSDPITFVWSLTTLPPGSNAAITPSDGVSPSFVPDLAGSYIAQLIVSDGQLSSVPATVVVTVNAANRKPIAVAEAIPTQTTVGSPVVLKGSASSDPDGDPLTWSWSIALRPGGSNASIVSPTAAQTSFVPDVPGIYTIQLVVRDGKVDSVPALVVVEAVAANHPPRIISSPPTLAVAGQAYSYPIVATDDDPGDVLTYSLVLAPPGMVMDGSSGRIQWVPQVDQVGSHGVTVRVSDRSGAFTEQSYSVTVSLSNRAPAIASTPLTIAAGGIPYSYAVNGTDPDAGDVLTYSLTSLPTGMSISQTTGLINWTPEETQGGNHLVTVRVQDTGGLFAEQSYTISVCAAPPPGMVGWWGGEGDGRDLLGRFNGTLVDAPGFAPGKVDQAFSLVGGPEHVSIPDDAALNLVDAISVEAWIKPSAFVAGYDPIVKKAGEGLGQTDGYALEFLGQNVAFFVDVPGWFLSEWFLSAPAPLNLGEWMHVVGTYDGSYVRLYANGVRVDPPTHAPGRIKASGNPLNIGHDPANPNRAFSGLIDEATIYNRALSLEEVQAIYRMGSAGKCKAGFPMANAGPDQSVDEGATVTLDGTISKDPAGRPITFAWSILNSPAGSSPVLSGAATGMPTLLADKRGIYIAQLIVNNGLTESLPDTVVIRAAAVPNHAPRITPSPPTIAVVGKTYSYPVVAADDDVGDALTYSFRRVPFYPVPAEMTINAANGLIVWTPTLAQVGSHYVTVRVTDAGGLVAEETFVLVVTPTPPVITSAPVTSATVAQPYTYAVTATDPDPGDTLTYSLTTAPPGMVIDGASGLIQWTPTAAQAGDHPVEVKVQDAGGLFVTQPFTLSVAAVLVCVPPPSGLVSWWPGDGNTLDRAAASDGLAENGASYAAGLVGQAFRFDGVDDLTRIASSRTTGFAGAFSVEFWFNPTTTINVSTPNQMLLAKGRYLEGGFNAPVAIQVLGGDGRLLVRMPSAPALVSSTDTWPAGTWQHIALSWDGARYRLYVNGSEEAGLDNAFSIFDSSDPITLGNADGFAAGGFAGLLDEPTLYNRALTPAEVNALHAARGLGKCTATYSRADAGPDQAVEVAATVTLDGSASRAFDGAPLSYQWTLTSRPANSAAVLANPATVSPSFTADKAGAYTLDLIVSNAGRASAPDSVSITAAKVNHPPTITSTAITAGAVGTAYTYPVTASDPDPGDTLTFSLTTAPAGMSINAASGLIQWTPNAGQIGSHAVTIRVQDQGGLFAPQSFLVVVAATPVPVSVPSVVGQEQAAAQSAISAASLTVGTVSLAASDTVAAGRVISQNPTAGTLVSSGSAVALVVSSGQAGPAVTAIRVTPLNALILTGQSQAFAATGILSNGSSLPLTSGLTWTSSTPAVASIDVAGVASALSEGSTTISVSQGGVSGSTTLNVKAAVADGTKPTAAITAPTSGATVSTAIPVTGTAADDNFLKYVLEIAPFGQPSFTTIAVGTVPVVNGALGVLDPTTLVNDYYLLRLTVFDRAGNQQTAEVDFQVARDKKVGNFTLAFQDVNVPMAGIPISVVRSYDSRDKTKGDFGIGWRLDVNSIRLRVTGVEGADWFEDKTLAGIFPTYSLAPTRKHLVTITLPDGRVEEFDFSVVPSSREFVPLDIVRATYVPRGITRGSLRPADADELLVQSTAGVFPGAVELYAIVNPVAPYAPAAYDYTTPEGQTIRITRAGVVQYIRDRNGNTVTFGPLGVTHSAGLSIAFTRDSEGRITQVTDPNGNVQRYAYDINGDLASHTDAQGRVTSFLYNYEPWPDRNPGPARCSPDSQRVRRRRPADQDHRRLRQGDRLHARARPPTARLITDRLGRHHHPRIRRPRQCHADTTDAARRRHRPQLRRDAATRLARLIRSAAPAATTYDGKQDNRLSETDALGQDHSTTTYNNEPPGADRSPTRWAG